MIPTHLRNDLRIESSFDRALYGTGTAEPPLLYHDTSWEAAEQIIRSQRFWATAHDCTNDKDELIYADAAILEAARALELRTDGLARRMLRLFSKTYLHTRIGSSRRTYLVCFSKHSDDPHQWAAYGHRGAGVCLGLRLFHIPNPVIPGIATGVLPVNYREEEPRTKLSEWFVTFAGAMKGVRTENENVHIWRDALAR